MRPTLVALVDLFWVLVFAAVGRVSHGEALTPSGLATTAWPFVAGWLLGWALVLLLLQARARALGPAAGVLVWLPTVAVGMLLRLATGAGVQASFVVVTAVVLGVFLLGWRGLAGLVMRRRGRARGRATPLSLH